MDRCCIVFGENRNSLIIQNGGPKFARFAYLCEISQCLRFFTHFCIKQDRLIPNIYSSLYI